MSCLQPSFRMALIFFTFFTTSQYLNAQTYAELEAENAALHAQVDAFEALLAQSGGMCGEAAQGQVKALLMRKLAQHQKANALIALGLQPGPVWIPNEVLSAVVADEYIVLTSVRARSVQEAAQFFGIRTDQVIHVYQHAIMGFSVRLNPAEAAKLAQHTAVENVVENGMIFGAQTAGGRVGQPSRLKGVQGMLTAPAHQKTSTEKIDVFLFDTGIRASHLDLVGTVSPQFFSAFDNGLGGEDCSGHGTHVAARIAGIQLGQTNVARLISVKVIDSFGTGNVATVIAGIDWVLSQPDGPKLINMSLTRRATLPNGPLDLAVETLLKSGATIVVAAGNGASNVAEFTPARIPGVITVGSVNSSGLSWFSNAGEGVDIYAPGEGIVSASIREVCGIRTLSGTSMAAPLVTGLIAERMARGQSGHAAFNDLLMLTQTVNTGAFEGEVTRRILPTVNPEISGLCDAHSAGLPDERITLGVE